MSHHTALLFLMSSFLEHEPHMMGTCLLLVNPSVSRTAPIMHGRGHRGCHQRLGEVWLECDSVLPSLGHASSPLEDSLYLLVFLSTLSFMHGKCSPGNSKLPSINAWVEAHSAASCEDGERRWLDVMSELIVSMGIFL